MTAPISDVVVVNTTVGTVGLSRPGFGTAMYLSAYAAFAERIRTYGSLADVAVDFSVTTSPEYLVAQQYFAQSPKPQYLKIGRSALPPTQVYTLSVATVRNSYVYSIAVKGKSVTTTTATYTSDSSATDGEIVVGIVAALNAVTGNNYIAAGTTSPFTVTADAAGDWFSLQVDSTDFTLRQSHADPGVATDLAAIDVVDSDWYALLTGYNSPAYVAAAAAYIETQKKIYIADDCGTLSITAAVGGGGNDLADNLHTSNYQRTAIAWHAAPAAMLGASWAGKRLPIDPGGETWKFAQPSGISGSTLTATHRVNLRAKQANWLEASGGVTFMQEGYVAGTTNLFIDVTRALDWLNSEIQLDLLAMLLSVDKQPFTDSGGRAAIKGTLLGTLQRGVQAGVLSPDVALSVTVPKVAEISTANRTARHFAGVTWSAQLSGAIHKVTVSGVVTA